MPIFQLPLADQSASATCSVDLHETPMVASTSLAAKVKALTQWNDGVPEMYSTTVTFPTLRSTVLALVVPAATGQQ